MNDFGRKTVANHWNTLSGKISRNGCWLGTIPEQVGGKYKFGKLFYKYIIVDSFRVSGYQEDTVYYSMYFRGPTFKGEISIASILSFNSDSAIVFFKKSELYYKSGIRLKKKPFFIIH